MRPVLALQSISSTKGTVQAWGGGGTAPGSFVNVTCIPRCCLVLGQLGSGLLARDQDGEQEGKLHDASISSGSFQFQDDMPAWCSIWRLTPDIWSSKSLDLVAIDMIVVDVNWTETLDQVTRNGHKGPCKKWKNHLVCINCIFFTLIQDPFICHQWRSLADVGTPPTWEKVVTYLLEPLDFGNIRDGHNPSQLPLPNQIFRILPLCTKPTQGHQKCDRLHRDARWIGGLSHQSSNLSCLHNLLWKVVIHAYSDTGFEWYKVANYLAN